MSQGPCRQAGLRVVGHHERRRYVELTGSRPQLTWQPPRLSDVAARLQVFAEFDTDSSGAIDWAEFKAMLPKLGVVMNEAKALKCVAPPLFLPRAEG